MGAATVLVYCLGLYGLAGLCIAVAFVIFGVARAAGAPVSVGARILFIPAAAALWPYVLMRWLSMGRAP